MSLSVIIPCLNEAAGITHALEALQPLRARGAEVIVVDGGSSDATRTLAEPLADIFLTAPRGRAAQMNAGAEAAHGSILLFLHADCALPEAADALVIQGLERSRLKWGRFDVRITGNRPLLRVIGAMMNRRSRLTGIATGDQGLFVTRTLFEAAGRFPMIALMEDIALCARLKSFGPPLCIPHPMTVSGRRWEKHGVVRTMLFMWWLRLRYWLGANPDDLARRYRPHRE